MKIPVVASAPDTGIQSAKQPPNISADETRGFDHIEEVKAALASGGYRLQ